jgi:hypothetical protein
MMMNLLALWQNPPGQWNFADYAVVFVVFCGLAGIALIVLRNSGVQVPQWVWQIIGLVALIIVAILAIRLIASL